MEIHNSMRMLKTSTICNLIICPRNVKSFVNFFHCRYHYTVTKSERYYVIKAEKNWKNYERPDLKSFGNEKSDKNNFYARFDIKPDRENVNRKF